MMAKLGWKVRWNAAKRPMRFAGGCWARCIQMLLVEISWSETRVIWEQEYSVVMELNGIYEGMKGWRVSIPSSYIVYLSIASLFVASWALQAVFRSTMAVAFPTANRLKPRRNFGTKGFPPTEPWRLQHPHLLFHYMRPKLRPMQI